jgi:hypothetical protein
MPFMTRTAVLALAIFVFTIGTAAAQQGTDGVMNGVAFKPLPPDSSIHVRPLDNSDDNLVLQADFEAALRAKGYTIEKDAKLILSFETRDEIGSWSTTERRHILSFESKGGQGGGENAKAKVNVFDSATGGLLNRGSGGGTTITSPSTYRIDATIDDRANGKRLWQGSSVANLNNQDGLSLTRKMVPVMVENLGQTVRRQIFPLN